MADSHHSAIAYQRAHSSDNRIAEIIAPTVIFLTIAYAAVFLRYKSRRIANLRLEAEYVFSKSIILLSDETLSLEARMWYLYSRNTFRGSPFLITQALTVES